MVRLRRDALPTLLLGALAGVAAAAFPGSLGAQRYQPDPPQVRSVSFPGHRAIDEEALRAAIVTAPTRCSSPALTPVCWLGIGVRRESLHEDVLRADVLRLQLLYYERGFREASVHARTGGDGENAEVEFLIEEGPPIRVGSVDVLDDGEPADHALTAGLPLAAGEPLDLTRYSAGRDTLAARLRNRGHARAEVLANYMIPAERPYLASVSYDLIPGERARFGEIEVIGNESVSSSVVERLLTFRTGDVFSDDEILRSQRNLFALDLFRHAQIRAEAGETGDALVPVRVEVNEGFVHMVRFGLGMSTAECASADGLWVSRNFLGGARRLELRSRVSNVFAEPLGAFPCFDSGGGVYGDLTGSVSANFTQPWAFGPLNSLGAGVFVERQSIPDVFVRTSSGAYVALTRRVGRRTTATLAYRPELASLRAEGDLIFCVSFVVCALREEVQVLADAHWLAPVSFRVQRDRTNALFAPTRGDLIRVEAEVAGRYTGSEFGYTRVLADASWYHELAPGFVLANRLRPGWARALGEPAEGVGLGLHPERRFFAGGSNSVRGFANYGLGPRILMVDAAGVLAAPEASGGAGCTAQEINAGACEVGGLEADRFGQARPVGGAVLFEGNTEVRFPLWGQHLRGAAFLDFGQVWSQTADVDPGEVRWTPGMGLRYFSPVGPVRIDVGYARPLAERLPVLTTTVCARTVDAGCIPIEDGVSYDPAQLANTKTLRSLDGGVVLSPGSSVLDRLQLHFSIGQAF